MLKNIKEELIGFGFKEKEIEVYLALLNQGELTAHQISTLTKINRSTTYVQIQALSSMGLVTSYKRGKKTFFACESPRALQVIFKKRSQEIDTQQKQMKSLLPSLLELYGAGNERPVVRMFDGKEGLTTMREEILQVPSKELYVVFNIDAMLRIYSREELMAYSHKRSRLKKKAFTIYTTIGDDIPAILPQELKRVSAEKLPFGSDVYICGDVVAFASTDIQICGVMIQNSDIANSMRTLFLQTWCQK